MALTMCSDLNKVLDGTTASKLVSGQRQGSVGWAPEHNDLSRLQPPKLLNLRSKKYTSQPNARSKMSRNAATEWRTGALVRFDFGTRAQGPSRDAVTRSPEVGPINAGQPQDSAQNCFVFSTFQANNQLLPHFLRQATTNLQDVAGQVLRRPGQG
jgi:hypothetical protein